MEAIGWVPVCHGFMAVSHRPKKKIFPTLKLQGCTHLLTLLSEREGAREIGDAAKHAGIEWLWFPLESGDPLDSAREVEVRSFFEQIRPILESPHHILVHCSAGIHRTGMVTYALLRYLGLEPTEARSKLHEMRPMTADGVGDNRLAWGDGFGKTP